MNLRIYDPEAEQLAYALASESGEPMEEAVLRALRERLGRILEEKRNLPKRRRPNRGRKNRR
ncbi:MAG: type II toxin-antitoxin system VapB family antitoxin [Candidatus Acidiferrum sp.]